MAASTYVVTLTVADSGGAMTSDTAIVSVVGNQSPTAGHDTEAVTRSTTTTIDVLSNDSDLDGFIDPNSIVIISGPVRSGSSQNPGTATAVTGGIEYTAPGGNVKQSIFLTYTVKDNLGAESNVATVTINVNR